MRCTQEERESKNRVLGTSKIVKMNKRDREGMASVVRGLAECSFWKLSGKSLSKRRNWSTVSNAAEMSSKMSTKVDSEFSHMEIPGTTTKVISGNDRHERLNGVA